MMPLSRLLAMRNHRNPKTHDIDEIIASIARNGFKAPPMIDESTDTMVAGHGRAKALERMRFEDMAIPEGVELGDRGEWMVPTLIASFKDEASRDAFLIADNRISELGGVDSDMLTALLQGLAETDDGLTGTGYDDDDLAELLCADEDHDGREIDVEGHVRVIGASGESDVDAVEIDRDTWCTPKWIADALGAWDLDPCSNERSHIQSARSFRFDERGEDGLALASSIDATARVFVNPPYSAVAPWIAAYGHTRFCFLLKFDPSTKWFTALMALTELVLIPQGTRIQFEAPPGVPPEKSGSNQFPHALFFARAVDASDDIRAKCMPMPGGFRGGRVEQNAGYQPPTDDGEIPDAPANPITKAGDIWQLGDHVLFCGDSRGDTSHLFAGAKAAIAITSPPYASQRAYDESSPFRPIAPDDYIEWFDALQANVRAHLADDGSWFLNIRSHCDDGQRHLYVMDLVIAHVRQWGWNLVDDFIWRNTRNGTPGGWNNRFKNAWEPVFHFSGGEKIKFRPQAVSTQTDATFRYSANNAKSPSGSGLLGSSKATGYESGLARPSNVIDAPAESGQGKHSAPFPMALPAFFISAFTDPGDIVFEPFCGSGTTLIAAEKLGRRCIGVEISPAYCDVIIERWENASCAKAIRVASA